MVLTGIMTNLWQFYLFFGIILSASMGIFQVPLTASVTMWFRRRLGVGMGILQSAQGIGPLVAVPIMLLVITLFGGGLNGLRAAFWVPGIIGECGHPGGWCGSSTTSRRRSGSGRWAPPKASR